MVGSSRCDDPARAERAEPTRITPIAWIDAYLPCHTPRGATAPRRGRRQRAIPTPSFATRMVGSSRCDDPARAERAEPTGITPIAWIDAYLPCHAPRGAAAPRRGRRQLAVATYGSRRRRKNCTSGTLSTCALMNRLLLTIG